MLTRASLICNFKVIQKYINISYATKKTCQWSIIRLWNFCHTTQYKEDRTCDLNRLPLAVGERMKILSLQISKCDTFSISNNSVSQSVSQ